MTTRARRSERTHPASAASAPRLGWPLAAAALVGVCRAFGASRWQRKTKRLRSDLEVARVRIPTPAHDVESLADLPPPVQRYFRIALRPGQAMISAASLLQVGTLNLRASGGRWKPFGAEQRVRFLAKAAWYPTALLPSQGARWEVVDANSAEVTLDDGATQATLLFTFDSAGLVESASAEARGAAVGKTVVMMPREGRWANYRSCDGVQVPTEGEAAWLTPQGRKPYWRGSVDAISYEYELLA